MAKSLGMTTTTISVITRHSEECPITDPQWKRCKCRKSLYIYETGKVTYKSAKTRSWDEAERFAQGERDLRDPVKIELKKMAAIQAAESGRARALEANQITVEDAANRWLKSQKDISDSTAAIYRSAVRKICSWAKAEGVIVLRDVTPELLDQWRSRWSPTATHKDDRLQATSQSHLLTRIKSFFKWSTRHRLISFDPSLPLDPIAPSDNQTMPLTPVQFEQLLAATELYDAGRRPTEETFGKDLRVLFLVMRWSGLRIADALMLPRSALIGNRLSLTTLKTRAITTPMLPDSVVAELKEFEPKRGTHPDFFFWSNRSNHLTLTTTWCARIRELNEFLFFLDERGRPMRFRSHMLRDTFAVELFLAGVSLEDVSRLLTHKSIRTTEKYYSPWIEERRKQLEERAVAAMRKMGAAVGGK